MGKIVLILGGARSGKSALALAAAQHFQNVLYYATAFRAEEDSALLARIKMQSAERPAHWTTVELPSDLEEVGRQGANKKPQLLVLDCATLWLSWVFNESFSGYSLPQLGMHLEKESEFFVQTLIKFPCPVLVISNEVGSGVVPSGEPGRLYRDILGVLNTKLAIASSMTMLTIAGIPLVIKNSSENSICGSEMKTISAPHLAEALKKLTHEEDLLNG